MKAQLRKGAWIASTKKHLDRAQYSAEIEVFRATDIAGKAANLLGLMQADQAEVIQPPALQAYCIAAKVRPLERDAVLKKLEQDGRIEVRKSGEEIIGVDVYVFSKDDVLRSASNIFEKSDPTDQERASLEALEQVCLLPRTRSELIDHLTGIGFDERSADLTLELQRQLRLVGYDESPSLDEPIVFNEYAFVREPSAIVAAINRLSPEDRRAIQDIQYNVEASGCSTYGELSDRFPNPVLRTMEGLGLLDRQEVISPFGNLEFATLPQTFGVYGGDLGIAVDCFHHAKMLLCCLRYGVVKSTSGRGRIIEPTWILSKLLTGAEVGPCEAIGQDYGILEREGVVSLRLAAGRYGRQYFMKLRKREVGELAMQVLTFGRAITGTEAGILPKARMGLDYIDPQSKRVEILNAAPVRSVQEIQARILSSLRT